MKMIDIKGLKLEIVELDYNFFQKEVKKLEEKGKLEKAQILKKLIANLDDERKNGKEINSELIEEVVNRSIEEGKTQIKELKQQIKKVETEINMLSKYSEKEQEDGSLGALIV